MNYTETLEYLYSRLPMFSSQGKSAIRPGLQNTLDFCRELGNPQNKFKSIHIGGTNGKGSTSHMLAAILQTAGYKTGLYTSPHLKDFRERIRINGKMIAENDVIHFVSEHRRFIEELEPSFFEVTVAMAFKYFANNQVDVAIIEVGLGGRLDSTNVILPQLTLISNISFDHMNILGDTLPQIAAEKAGIIKSGVPLVVSQRQDEISGIFVEKAKDLQAELVFGSDEWIISRTVVQDELPDFLTVEIREKKNAGSPPYFSFEILKLDLTGTYQLMNLAGVLSAVRQLRMLSYSISDENIVKALKQVKSLTGLMGRWQTIQNNPLIICDTGHNEAGITEVLKNIELTPYNKLHMVIGMVKDKDISKVLKLLPVNAYYYFCQPDIPRAKSSQELCEEAKIFGLNGKSFSSVRAAVDSARSRAEKNDLIFIGGSTFVVAEFI